MNRIDHRLQRWMRNLLRCFTSLLAMLNKTVHIFFFMADDFQIGNFSGVNSTLPLIPGFYDKNVKYGLCLCFWC